MFKILTRRSLQDELGDIETDPDGWDAVKISDAIQAAMRLSGGVIPMYDYADDPDDPEELPTGLHVQDDKGRRGEPIDASGPIPDIGGAFWKSTIRYRLKNYEEFVGIDNI